MMRKGIIIILMALLASSLGWGQEPGNEAYPADCNGLPIRSVTILLEREGEMVVADSLQTADFSNAFNIYPGSTFNQSIANMSVARLMQEPDVASASYRLFSNTPGAPVSIVVRVRILGPDEHKTVNGLQGMAATRSARDFPLIVQGSLGELTLICNGAVGLFDDVNGFFAQGKALTRGNPIADDPEGKGSRFWGEAYIEPGIAGIVKLGDSQIYAYGAMSGLVSGRNASDAFSHGAHCYLDFEKLYAGFLFSRLGRKKDMSVNISAGRQNFQLNDGFLISWFSGSASAGPRANTYLNSRTAFHMTGIAKWTSPRWTAEAFYLEPQELERHQEMKMRYAGSDVEFHSGMWNPGIAFISRVGGEGDYYLPGGKTLEKKGLMVINPKLWLSDIAGTGIFFKSEYAYEWHKGGGMSANAWYAGVGADLHWANWKPRFYYRYAFMQGDNPKRKTYSRFDPILTGGLAEWVQGINMVKVAGLGNIVTNRVEIQVFPRANLNFEFDWYDLRADSRYNVGGAAALCELKSKHLGDELTLQCNWSINRHFLVLGLISTAIPGEGLRKALPKPVKAWTTFQLNLFMFF